MGLAESQAEFSPLTESAKPAGLLRLQEVTKTYVTDGQSVHALNGVSLDAQAGEFIALVGRSGCGKSTC